MEWLKQQPPLPIFSPLWSVSGVSFLSAASAFPAAGPDFLQPFAQASPWFQSNPSLFIPVKASHKWASMTQTGRNTDDVVSSAPPYCSTYVLIQWETVQSLTEIRLFRSEQLDVNNTPVLKQCFSFSVSCLADFMWKTKWSFYLYLYLLMFLFHSDSTIWSIDPDEGNMGESQHGACWSAWSMLKCNFEAAASVISALVSVSHLSDCVCVKISFFSCVASFLMRHLSASASLSRWHPRSVPGPLSADYKWSLKVSHFTAHVFIVLTSVFCQSRLWCSFCFHCWRFKEIRRAQSLQKRQQWAEDHNCPITFLIFTY